MPSLYVDFETFEALQRYRLRLATEAGSAVGISMNSAVHHLLISNPPYPGRAEPDLLTYNNPMPAETIDIPDGELVGVASSGSVVWAAKHKGTPAQFVYKRCSLGSQYSASAKDLYAEFQEWCKETGTYCPSQRGFGMQLTAMGLQRKRRNGGTHWWEGIRISGVSESGHPKQPVEMRRPPPRVAEDEAVHHEEPPVSNLGHRVLGEDVGEFELGFKTVVGRPESKDEVIQHLLDGIFSGALERRIDLQLSRDGSGRWISFPDNFMSIRLQPRNKALLVTVYGDPKSLNELPGHALDVKADRKPYARFHVRSAADLSPALDIIKASRALRAKKSRLASRLVYIPTLEEQRIRAEEYRILGMGNPESDNGSNFTCSPAGLRGPFEEKWFDSIMAVKGLFSTLPSNTREAFTGEFQRLAAMTRKSEHSSSTYEIYDELHNQASASSPLTSGIFDQGVFIRLKEDEVSKWESKIEVIERSSKMIGSARRLGLNEGVEPIMARMVLVHTFAHVIMRQLARDCGLPISGFRERLYAGEGKAAVLIYASGENPASSLGHVIDQSLPETLETTASKGLADAIWCSNDPMCIGQTVGQGLGGTNLGACHACAVLPEVSCEAMNCFLDRGLLVQTGYAAGAGFFPSYASRSAERTVPR